MKITIETIPHAEQRYETAGDWQFDEGNLTIHVSNMGNWKHEALVAFHELAEALACRAQGVTAAQVDAFDRAYGNRREGAEPGDDPDAPYYRQHFFASTVERMLSDELDVDWAEYDATLTGLCKNERKDMIDILLKILSELQSLRKSLEGEDDEG